MINLLKCIYIKLKDKPEIGTLLIGVAALFISVYTVFRDKKSRQIDILDRMIKSITDLSVKISDVAAQIKSIRSIKSKNYKAFELQLKMLTTEYKNKYEYLAFLINNGDIKDFHAYTLGSKELFMFFDGLSLRKQINPIDYKEIYKLVEAWRKIRPYKFTMWIYRPIIRKYIVIWKFLNRKLF